MSAIPGFLIKNRLRFFLTHPFIHIKEWLCFIVSFVFIARSGLFDRTWYLQQNKDVSDSEVNPLSHYIRRGAYEGRDPNPLFSSDWYLRQNPNIAAVRQNPLVHYIRHGIRLERNPSPYFDTVWYISNNKDLIKMNMHPLLHYLKLGVRAGLRPIPKISFLHRWIQKNKKKDLPKVLIIDRMYPRPDQESGSIDCINYIKIFQEFGYQVFFASVEEYNREPEIYKELEYKNILCLNPADYLTIDEFIESEIEGFSAVFLSRVSFGGRFYELIKEKNPEIKIIFNTVDLHSIREEREAEINKDPEKLKRAFETAEREQYLASHCDATIVVSEYEQKYLASGISEARIVYIPLMRDCPGRDWNFSERSGICFIGGYRHTPNVDALVFFLDHIWPLILEKLPDGKFYIIGPGLPEVFKNKNDPNIVILGHVPDLISCLNKIRVSVAPLRYGAGAKGKVVTSLANGLPCVATAIAVEGMGFENGRHIAVEDSPEAFANRVVLLYENRGLWTKMSDEGLDFCSKRFTYDAGRDRMSELFENLGLSVAKN